MYGTLDGLKNKLSEDELIRLTDDQDLGVIDEVIINAAIEAASMEVDSYLGERYSLPLDPVPGIVTNISQDIAVYNLYARNAEGPTEHWEKRYENATKLLGKISEGEVTLGSADPDSGESELPEISSSVRLFSRDSMKGY